MWGTLDGRKDTAEGDHRLYAGKQISLPFQFQISDFVKWRKSNLIFHMIKLIWSFSLWQVSFEKERALLITRATVAEAQVSELQDYVDKHLGRSGGHWKGKFTHYLLTTVPMEEWTIPLLCRSCNVVIYKSVVLNIDATCRYKEEITHLRRLHGKPEGGRSQSANSSLH